MFSLFINSVQDFHIFEGEGPAFIRQALSPASDAIRLARCSGDKDIRGFIAEFDLVAYRGQIAKVRYMRPVMLKNGTGVVGPAGVIVLWVELGEPHRREADGFPCDTRRLDAGAA